MADEDDRLQFDGTTGYLVLGHNLTEKNYTITHYELPSSINTLQFHFVFEKGLI